MSSAPPQVPADETPAPAFTGGPPRLSVLAALTALCAMAVYRPMLSAKFIALDDPQYVTDNAYILSPSADKFVSFFTEVLNPSTVGGYYQPLTMASLMIDRVIEKQLVGEYRARPDPFVYHLNNTLLHGLNAALVFLLAWYVVRSRVLALIAAMLFAVHPLNVETVAWVCQRKALLSTTFVLLTLLTYGRWAKTRNPRWFWLALACFVLSLLAKPTSLLLPLVLLLADVWPLRRTAKSMVDNRALISEKVPFFIAAALLGWIAYESQRRTSGLAEVVATTDPWRSTLITCHNVVFYLVKSIVPVRLCPQYPLPANDDIALSTPAFLIGLLGSVAIAALIVVAWRRGWRPVWTMLLGYYLLLAPSLGPVRFMGAIAGDRFAYTPMILLVILAAAGMRRLGTRWQGQSQPARGTRARTSAAGYAVFAFAGAVLLLFSYRTYAQQSVWQNTRAYYQAVADRYPTDPAGHHGLGAACLYEHDELLAQPDHDPAHADRLLNEALRHFARAIELRDSYSDAYFQIGEIYRLGGRPDDAVTWIRKGLGFAGSDKRGYFFLGLALGQLGRLDEAIDAYKAYLAVKPSQREAVRNIANALARTGRFEESLPYFSRLSKLDPNDADGLHNWGTALASLGDFNAALKPLVAAFKLNEARYYELARNNAPEEQLREVEQKIADTQFAAAGADAALGRDAETLALLQQACAAKPALWDVAQKHPLFEKLRKTEGWSKIQPPTTQPASTQPIKSMSTTVPANSP